MKFLFIVQGEGRGHFTQALAMSEMLRERGNQVVGVLVGKSAHRQLPGFFTEKIQAPVSTFESPNFLPAPQNKRPELFRSIWANAGKLPAFYRSIRFIRQNIKDTQPDIVINFYELLTGFTYLFMPPGVPQVCIGHQYMFLHKGFEFPAHVSWWQLASLRFFSRMTSIGAVRRLALSFYPAASDEEEGITVVPPLIRKEVRRIPVRDGDYWLGYMLNSGYVSEVAEWSGRHPEVSLHFFWDKKEAPEISAYSDRLTLHRINDTAFVQYMAGCRAYSTTAGFESVCEALYLRKPVLMVPAHIEQECNAWDACKVGAGVVAARFDLSLLQEFLPYYQPVSGFRFWADKAESRICAELDAARQPSPAYRIYDRLYQACNIRNLIYKTGAC